MAFWSPISIAFHQKPTPTTPISSQNTYKGDAICLLFLSLWFSEVIADEAVDQLMRTAPMLLSATGTNLMMLFLASSCVVLDTLQAQEEANSGTRSLQMAWACQAVLTLHCCVKEVRKERTLGAGKFVAVEV